MDILSSLPGFALAFILIFCYEYRIRLIKTKPKNKVYFYVKAVEDNVPWLFIQKRTGMLVLIDYTDNFADYGLNSLDFCDMKKDEIREVFLNLKN